MADTSNDTKNTVEELTEVTSGVQTNRKRLSGSSGLKKSDREAKPAYLRIVATVIAIACIGYFLSWVGGYQPGGMRRYADQVLAQGSTPEPSPESKSVDLTFGLPSGDVSTFASPPGVAPSGVVPATSTPIVIVVTATPTPAIPTPIVEYVDRVQYVDRIEYVDREVVVIATPVPTPVLFPGHALICVYLEGGKALYLDGSGMGGGECREVVFYEGVNQWVVRVDR